MSKGAASVNYPAEQWQEICQLAARMLVEEIREAAGGIDAMVQFPLATVTTITGLSRQTIPKRMPVVDCDGKLCVTLKAVREWQLKNTRQPLQALPSPSTT